MIMETEIPADLKPLLFDGQLFYGKWGELYFASKNRMTYADLSDTSLVRAVYDNIYGRYFLYDIEPHWQRDSIMRNLYRYAKPWVTDLSGLDNQQLIAELLHLFQQDELRVWQLSDGWAKPAENAGAGPYIAAGSTPAAGGGMAPPPMVKKSKSGGSVKIDDAKPVQLRPHNSEGHSQIADCKVIVLAPGAKGCWNKKLNSDLEPNATYQVGEYLYQTDELGRVVTVSGQLDLTKQDRNTHQQTKAGKTGGIKDGAEEDEGGHLIACIFNGPGEQINYAAMDGNLNKGAWKKMENDWAAAIKGPPPKNVDVKINAIYEGDSKRAEAFEVEYYVDGEMYEAFFENRAGG